MSRPPVIADRRVALIGGLVLAAAGAWLLSQAYDARGRSKPYLLRLFPGA